MAAWWRPDGGARLPRVGRTLFDECCKLAILRAIDRVSRAHADRIVGIDAQGLLGRPFDPARDAPSQELARRCAGRTRVRRGIRDFGLPGARPGISTHSRAAFGAA